MNPHAVSCMCLTFGRTELLNESIECFHRQQWGGRKELVVVNDHPRQTLVYDHPEVRVFNLPYRMRTLGEKRNFAAACCEYDNLLVWDDDDLYLPWRIEETMKVLPDLPFFKCPHAWTMNNDVINPTPSYNRFHGGAAYTRRLFNRLRGYRPINTGEDADFENRLQNVTRVRDEFYHFTKLQPSRLYYVYRWSHGHYHATGVDDLKAIDPKVIEGTIVLSPKWRTDYLLLVHDAAASANAAGVIL